MNNFSISACIDFFKDGFLNGWSLTTSRLDESNEFDLLIDDVFICRVDATRYREDLTDSSKRMGMVGFSTPIPLFFCDNNIHTVSILEPGTKNLITSKKISLQEIKHLVRPSENIVFDKINRNYSGDNKVIFLAGFTNELNLLNYQKHLVASLQEAGFYVIYILASDCPDRLLSTLNFADRMIVRKNVGYDFGSWAVSLQMCYREFFEAEHIVWMNDSIIGPLTSMDILLEKIDCHSRDLWAITESQEGKYHFQSYMWGLKKKANEFFPVIDHFFFFRYVVPQNKAEAIERYELEAFNFFKSQGCSVNILFPEYVLLDLAEKLFISKLHEHSKKWQIFFQLPWDKKELYSINSSIFNFYNLFKHRLKTNSSHAYWDALIEVGFPFIKRELLTLNPINYPFPGEFRSIFGKYECTELVDDLYGAIKFDRVL